jgi:uncharacterized protein (DUF1015 family)
MCVARVRCAITPTLGVPFAPKHAITHTTSRFVKQSERQHETRMVDTAAVTGGSNGVDVRPFRAWRLVPERLRDLADRHTTPWNLADSNDPSGAARILKEWKRDRVVVREQHPALYAYEQVGPRGTQRGVICAVHLDSRLLAHEDIIPTRAEEVTEVMRVGGMNLSPMLLGYSGDGRTSGYIAEAARDHPLTEVFTTDGQEHRLWRLPPEVRRDVVTELRSHAALIADGHHRHVAARQLRRQFYAAGHGPGPWDFASGLLVDVRHTPLRLTAIHRVLPNLDPHLAFSAASARFRVTALSGPVEEWLDMLRAQAYRGPAFVLVTADGAFLLTDPHPLFWDEAMCSRPEPIGQMHITMLQHLIETGWAVPEEPRHVHYEHSTTNAVRNVRQHGGVAVLLCPPHQRDLYSAAAAGVRLPHKTTSFGPKPHPGLLIRTLEPPRRD